MKPVCFPYDVALSFAEEDRAFVDCVAGNLRKRKLKVYYDNYERVDQWGKNLYAHLGDIYRNKARYCVWFISHHYKVKVWTKHERESALARAFAENREYILPFRIDNTEIPGLSDIINYLSIENYDCEALADAILEKITAGKKAQPIWMKLMALPRRIWLCALVLLLAGIFRKNIIPVEMLAKQLHEHSRIDHCAVCKDGEIHASEGRGACSGHGGVDHYIDSVAYHKSMDECRKEAKRISWWP